MVVDAIKGEQLGAILGDCKNSYYKPKWMERQCQSLKCVMWYEEIEAIQSSAKDTEMQSRFGRYDFIAVKRLTCQTFYLQAGNSNLGMNLQ